MPLSLSSTPGFLRWHPRGYRELLLKFRFPLGFQVGHLNKGQHLQPSLLQLSPWSTLSKKHGPLGIPRKDLESVRSRRIFESEIHGYHSPLGNSQGLREHQALSSTGTQTIREVESFRAVAAHGFNPSARKAEQSESLHLRPA